MMAPFFMRSLQLSAADAVPHAAALSDYIRGTIL
jgi:hypothetical protein